MGKKSAKQSAAGPPVSAGASQRSRVETLLKWVGGVTAVLSLVLVANEVGKLASDSGEAQSRMRESLQLGRQQQTAGDYAAAWTTFEQGLQNADRRSSLAKLLHRTDANAAQLRAAQADLAMAWLRNVRLENGQKFSEVSDKLTPVLARAAESAEGPRKADLLAHSGWAYFLKGRDAGVWNVEPDTYYRHAVEADSRNPYAHAWWGHWLLWKSSSDSARRTEAVAQFAAALASGRESGYVRKMQLAALRNVGWRTESARTVNEMRKNGETIDDDARRQFEDACREYTLGGDQLSELTASVPAAELLATWQTVVPQPGSESSLGVEMQAILATLQDAAGQPDQALQTWLAVRAALGKNGSGSLVSRADAEIKRLSKRKT